MRKDPKLEVAISRSLKLDAFNDICKVIKKHIPILEEFTPVLKDGKYKFGRDYEEYRCPFCSSEESTFKISHASIFYCSGCHKSGDVISFVALLKKMNQIDACRYLLNKWCFPEKE